MERELRGEFNIEYIKAIKQIHTDVLHDAYLFDVEIKR